MPCATMRWDGTPSSDLPSNRILPPGLTAMRPPIAFRSVVLPAPLAPRMTVVWPASASRLTLCSASCLPYQTLMFSSRSIVHPQIGVHDFGVGQDGLRRALGDLLARIEHDAVVAQRTDRLHDVL